MSTTTAYRGSVWRVCWPTNVYVRSGPNRETPKVAELLQNASVVELARFGDWIQHSTGWTLTRAGNNTVLQMQFSAPNENTSQAGTRVVWGSNVYVRQTTDRAALKVAELSPGQEVVELGRDGDWVKHSIGWTLARAGQNVVMKELGMPYQASGASANGPDTAPVLPMWKVVWSTNVYVRGAPSRDSPKTSELPPGTVVQELAREADWIKHSAGWTLARAGNNVCLERITSSTVLRTWKVVWATNVFVRGSPARDAAKVGELPPGTRVVELEASGDWIRHATGWSLTKAGSNVCLEVESVEGNAPRWKVVWATNVYVRAGPAREAAKVGELLPATTIQELGREGDWIRHSKGWTLAKAGNNVCLALVLPEGDAPVMTTAGPSYDPNMFTATGHEQHSMMAASSMPAAVTATAPLLPAVNASSAGMASTLGSGPASVPSLDTDGVLQMQVEGKPPSPSLAPIQQLVNGVNITSDAADELEAQPGSGVAPMH